MDNIIKETFTRLQDVYDNSKEGKKGIPLTGTKSRIIFPHYSTKYPNEQKQVRTRLSEQELRFVFVEVFNWYREENDLPWYYSVETPTEEKFRFSKDGKKISPEVGGDGQSAMIDLVIHNKESKRIALIEFKAHNKKEPDFEKDFFKLKNEPKDKDTCCTFFVMFVENYEDATIERLKDKIKTKGNDIKFYCWSLEKKEHIDQKIASSSINQEQPNQ